MDKENLSKWISKIYNKSQQQIKNSLEARGARENFQMRTLQMKISPRYKGAEAERRNWNRRLNYGMRNIYKQGLEQL